MGKKLAVLFPGIGYTCEKPLLYYSWKLSSRLGYEILPVNYSGFPSDVKANSEKAKECFHIALRQADAMLKDIPWEEYEDVVFFSKSVGTVVSTAFAKLHDLHVRSVLFTPVAETFHFADQNSIVFHGTADPWADTMDIVNGCDKLGIPLFLTDEGNHSLETGDVFMDLRILKKILENVVGFVEG